MKNQGRKRAKVSRKLERRRERKKDEVFGTIVKRRGKIKVSLD